MATSAAIVPVSTADGLSFPTERKASVFTELGDANDDGSFDIDDVTTLIEYLLNGDASQINLANSDVNTSGGVDIDDVTTMIEYLLCGYEPGEPPHPVTETFTVNGVDFKMVQVEGGTFTMGATPEQTDLANDSENPVHEVTLSDYAIGETEVKQELWNAVMGNNPSYWNQTGSGYLQNPVEQVTWEECQAFIYKLNELTGKNFRLPTEAEWEFAARGAKMTRGYKYAGSNNIDDVAYYSYFYDGPEVIASRYPNELGLYDMSGNVREWCQDWYDLYSSEAQTNPTGPTYGSYRVARGGNWDEEEWEFRVSNRECFLPTENACGFRLAL